MQIMPDGPGVQSFREWAFKNNLSQQQFSEALGLYANARSIEASQIISAAQRERELMGPNGPQRVDAISRWLQAKFPEEAKPLLLTMVTERRARFFEKVIQALTSQGSATFSQAHRDPTGGNGAMTQEQWNGMTFTQKQQWQQEQGGP
jgi:hypothetical protein